MMSYFVGTWKNSKQKKTLKFHLELNFNNFQEKKDGIFSIFNFLTIGIDIIGFSIKIISELVFTIILYLFLLHILLEGGY